MWKEEVKKFKLNLENFLNEFKNLPNRKDGIIFQNDFFAIELKRSSRVYENEYLRLAPLSDDDSGGYTSMNIQKHIPYCIEKKEERINKAKKEDLEWFDGKKLWLVLVDQIGLLGERDYLKVFLSEKKSGFDKILIINNESKNILDF